MVTVKVLSYKPGGPHIYNLSSRLAVPFLQGRRGPDLIVLIALAGQVCNVLGPHRPRSERRPISVSNVER